MARTIKVIGLSPGTRYIGFALFSDSDLRDWGVRNTRGVWSKGNMAKTRLFLLSMIHQHEANAICIKSIHPSRSSRNLDRLMKDIYRLAGKEKLRVYEYDIDEIKGFFHDGRITRMQLAEIVTSKYPALSYELNRERSIRNPYYIRMFEAVALGYMCFRKLEKRRKRYIGHKQHKKYAKT